MSDFKQYFLDYEKSYQYFQETISDVNILSKSIFEYLDFRSGHFFTFLSSDSNIEKHINNFKFGSIKPPVRDYIYSFVLNNVRTLDKICIVDDFQQNYSSEYKEDLFLSHGKVFDNEIYYLFTKDNISLETVQTAFRYSNIDWHSLAIIFQTKLEKSENTTLSKSDCVNICKNAEIILVTAFDAEGYIIWEKTPKILQRQRFLRSNSEFACRLPSK